MVLEFLAKKGYGSSIWPNLSMMHVKPRCLSAKTKRSPASKQEIPMFCHTRLTLPLQCAKRLPALSRFMSSTASATQEAQDEVLFQVPETSSQGTALHVTLHRPRALNALNLAMVRQITERYKRDIVQFQDKPAVTHVVMRGHGDRAFCSGGDIKAIAETRDPTFFKEEYELNHMIGTLPVPQVALLNGITMGGGVGLSVHGKFRVATEKTMFAMPESGIGFFCDVGGSYFLSRLGPLGVYLALTGSRLKGAQCLAAGVATHFVESGKLDELETALMKMDGKTDAVEGIEAVIAQFSSVIDPDVEAEFSALKKNVEEVFSLDRSVADTVVLLEKRDSTGDEWAKRTLGQLRAVSPSSLRIIHRQLNVGSRLSFDECFNMELGVAKHFMVEGHDFFEGVRALLVDKDKSPKWQPASIEQVTREAVDKYFVEYEHLSPKGEQF